MTSFPNGLLKRITKHTTRFAIPLATSKNPLLFAAKSFRLRIRAIRAIRAIRGQNGLGFFGKSISCQSHGFVSLIQADEHSSRGLVRRRHEHEREAQPPGGVRLDLHAATPG